jgi:hypothetical protein
MLIRFRRFCECVWCMMVLPQCSGPVAQLGARFHGMEEVKGSNPFRSTKNFTIPSRSSDPEGSFVDRECNRRIRFEEGHSQENSLKTQVWSCQRQDSAKATVMLAIVSPPHSELSILSDSNKAYFGSSPYKCIFRANHTEPVSRPDYELFGGL